MPIYYIKFKLKSKDYFGKYKPLLKSTYII